MRLFSGTFRQRVALLFLALSLVLGLPAYWYVDRVYERRLTEDDRQELRDLGNSIAAVLVQHLNERQREVVLLSQMQLYRRASLDSPSLAASIELVKESYPDCAWIGVANRHGRVRAATGGRLVGASVRDRPWFRAGLVAPAVLGPSPVSQLDRFIAQDTSDGRPWLIDFAAPVFDSDGKVRGVLGFRAHMDWIGRVIAPLMTDTMTERGLEVLVLGENDVVIHAVGGTALRALRVGERPAPSLLRDHRNGEMTYFTALTPVSAPSIGRPVGWRVIVRRPAALTLEDADALKQALLAFQLVAAVTFAALAWWIVALIGRPIEQLSDLARQVEQGDEPRDFAVQTSSVRVRALAGAMHGMAASLFSRQEALADSNREAMQRTAQLARDNERLRKLSRSDALTGLANRMAADERLNDEFIRMRRTGKRNAVLMLDIDHFKRVNDSCGHMAGDSALQHVGRILEQTVRECDFVARYGGDEFLVILLETGVADAREVARRILRAVAAETVPGVGTISLSIGLALSSPRQQTAEDAVTEADRCLYEAKRSGRDRVVDSGT